MPVKSRRRFRRKQKAVINRSLDMGGVTVAVPFRYYQQFSPSGGAVTFLITDLEPNGMGGRLPAMALNFQYFRFTQLKARMESSVVGVSMVTPTATVTSGGQRTFLAYSEEGSADVTGPSTIANLAQLDAFVQAGGNAKELVLTLNKAQLNRRGPKWFRTNTANTPPYDLLQQGSIYAVVDNDASWSGVGSNVNLLIEGICVFHGMTVNGVGFSADDRPVKVLRSSTTNLGLVMVEREEKKSEC